MVKKIYTLFLGASSLAWSMDAMNRENIHPNVPNQDRHSNKVQIDAVQKESNEPIQDNRTPEEIKKRIRYLKAEKNGYRTFNEEYYKVIQQLEALNFFKDDFPDNSEEVLKILESVFTNDHGQKSCWHPIVSELDRRPQSFMRHLNQLVDDVLNKNEEKNEEIRKILEEIYSAIGPASHMVIYYLKNK